MLGLLTYYSDARYVSIPCVSGCADGPFGRAVEGYMGSNLVVEDDFYVSFPARRPRRGDSLPVVLLRKCGPTSVSNLISWAMLRASWKLLVWFPSCFSTP